MLSKLITFVLLASTVSARAVPKASLKPRAVDTAAAVILAIAPKSSRCDGSPVAVECATNVQAAPHLIEAMGKYQITTYQEMAAVLSLIAFESADFKYNTNHFPGRPGQGTRAMFMPNYVLLYAQSIPELATPLAAVSSTDLNGILALVLSDKYTWASAAWFLTSQCANVRPAIQAGGEAGFEAYMGCVGTPSTPERLAYWTRANAAFGI